MARAAPEIDGEDRMTMTETETTTRRIPAWISDLSRLISDWSPEITITDSPVLSIPLGPEWVALEIEQGRTVVNGPGKGDVLSLHFTVRTWDRTGGMASETEVGEFTPEGARMVLPIFLAGIRAIAETESRAEDDDARRMAEDDAAWNTGGYVA